MAHARNSKASGKGKGSEKGSSEEQKEEMLTLDMFVSRTLPLIELEKEAEIAASKDSLAALTPDVAQKRGNCLLNLKCTDVQDFSGKHCWSFSQIEGIYCLHTSFRPMT